MKILISIFLFSSFLLSKTIDNTLLDIHATIMPKVLLLEYDIEKKIKDKKIYIMIAYEKNNYNDMKFLRDAIKRKYPNGISGYKIEITLLRYSEYDKCDPRANLLYIFPSSSKNINKLIKDYKKCNTVTFASDKEYLDNDAMISIDVGKKVKPIINLDAIKKSGISFKPVLLSISKVYKR